MKLELKHLAPYLPYSLKWKAGKDICNTAYLSTKRFSLIKDTGGIWKCTYDNLPKNVKPILRPISDLTKEIEHNGETFVPMSVLGKEYKPAGSMYDGLFCWETSFRDDSQDYYFDIFEVEGLICWSIYCGMPAEEGYIEEQQVLKYTTFQKLISWHFDVFGLIKSGLAIDINTLKNGTQEQTEVTC